MKIQNPQNNNGGDINIESHSAITQSIIPEPGLVLLFQHNMLHEGSALKTGLKYIMRTDVMFQRTSRNKQIDPNEAEALYYLKLAENYELNGNAEEAMQYYRKAFKKSTKLAKLYKM